MKRGPYCRLSPSIRVGLSRVALTICNDGNIIVVVINGTLDEWFGCFSAVILSGIWIEHAVDTEFLLLSTITETNTIFVKFCHILKICWRRGRIYIFMPGGQQKKLCCPISR